MSLTKRSNAYEELMAERDDIVNELKEQARLLGESGSREAALMAENNELRKALEMLLSQFGRLDHLTDYSVGTHARTILTKYPKQDEPNEEK